MRIYTNFYEAAKETERELFEMGCEVHPESMQDKDVRDNPDYDTKELQGYSYMITSHVRLREDFKKLGGDSAYADAELEERVSPHFLNPGYAWLYRKETWSPFLEKDKKFSYTYNARIREQLEIIMDELKANPNTRQAIITMYDRHQDINNLGGKRRIPCSLSYQFLRRIRNKQEYLDVIYTMRSCDIYSHFIYDVYLTMRLQEFIANGVGIEAGHFTHQIGSLHAYHKDIKSKKVF